MLVRRGCVKEKKWSVERICGEIREFTTQAK
jgi:hypothetical protein